MSLEGKILSEFLLFVMFWETFLLFYGEEDCPLFLEDDTF